MKNFLLLLLPVISFNLFSLMPVNPSEQEALQWLGESTKLAKDIYGEVYNIWGVELFKSIQELESKDYIKIKNLMENYNIKNPVANDVSGEYKSPYITKLYSDFKLKYDDSELEALRITATLEDLIISDINDYLETTTNSDFLTLFSNLRYSSIAEIRAINNYMKKKYDVEYQAQFLSREELRAILLN